MTESEPIRVIVVDDHDIVRNGLKVFLAGFDDLTFVGEAADGAEAIAVCAAHPADVVLMDLIMPGVGGVEAAREILTAQPDMRIIALTSFGDEALVRDALRAGMSGYLLKNASVEELAAAIRKAHAGQTVMAEEATQALIDAARNIEDDVPQDELTPRELDVLALMVEGLSNTDIADRLTVSRSTAKFHVSNILSKLGVTSRSEAVALAVRRNLVD